MKFIHARGRPTVLSAVIAGAACLMLAPAPAAAVVSTSVDGSGRLVLGGDGGSDDYVITCVGGSVKVNAANPGTGPAACASITLFSGSTASGDDRVDLAAVSSATGFTNPTLLGGGFQISISLGLGADVGLVGPFGGELIGEGGNDQLIGSDVRDRFAGGRGSDSIHGLGGPDLVKAGRYNDRVYGGPGNDALYGEGGSDLILGGAGADRLFGAAGNDALLGGSGPDRAVGANARDRCRAEVQARCEF